MNKIRLIIIYLIIMPTTTISSDSEIPGAFHRRMFNIFKTLQQSETQNNKENSFIDALETKYNTSNAFDFNRAYCLIVGKETGIMPCSCRTCTITILALDNKQNKNSPEN